MAKLGIKFIYDPKGTRQAVADWFSTAKKNWVRSKPAPRTTAVVVRPADLTEPRMIQEPVATETTGLKGFREAVGRFFSRPGLADIGIGAFFGFDAAIQWLKVLEYEHPETRPEWVDTADQIVDVFEEPIIVGVAAKSIMSSGVGSFVKNILPWVGFTVMTNKGVGMIRDYVNFHSAEEMLAGTVERPVKDAQFWLGSTENYLPSLEYDVDVLSKGAEMAAKRGKAGILPYAIKTRLNEIRGLERERIYYRGVFEDLYRSGVDIVNGHLAESNELSDPSNALMECAEKFGEDGCYKKVRQSRYVVEEELKRLFGPLYVVPYPPPEDVSQRVGLGGASLEWDNKAEDVFERVDACAERLEGALKLLENVG